MSKFLILIFIIFSCPLFAEEKNNATVPVPKLERDFYDWYKRHENVKKQIKKGPVDLVFIGDSITHMFGGLPKSEKPFGEEVWQKYYSKRNTVNMGFGWDRTQNVLWRLENGEFEGLTPKVVVLLIGTNNLTGTKNARTNTPEEIVEGIQQVYQLIHKKSSKTKILLLGILPRSPQKFVAPIRKINSLLKEKATEDYVTLLDMSEQFAEESGLPKKDLMRDSVHPSVNGYKVWAATMEPVLKKLLEE